MAFLSSATFPRPLTLLDGSTVQGIGDPDQPLQEWIEEGYRNKVTQARKTIYVVAPPKVDSRIDFIRSWTRPNIAEDLDDFAPLLETRHNGRTSSSKAAEEAASTLQSIISYLSAFYTPLPVRSLPAQLKYVPWTATEPVSQDPTHIGLQTLSSVVGIRTRPCIEASFPRQLNQLDLLDAAMEILPADAYALIMLTDFDLYEDDDDDFCCGRAFGGSRIAVVSSARYHPAMDEEQEIDQMHAWPASHSTDEQASRKRRRGKASKRGKPSNRGKTSNLKDSNASSLSSSPLTLAISAFTQPSSSSTPSTKHFYSLHLFRFLRTAVHELGHCFALDHCVKYACLMQATTALVEDVRQPPYLCPNCTAKVNLALLPVRAKKDMNGGSGDAEKEAGPTNSKARTRGSRTKATDRLGELERLVALRRYVQKIMGSLGDSESDEDSGVDRSWHAWNAWLGARIDELEREGEQDDTEDLSRTDGKETERVVIVID